MITKAQVNFHDTFQPQLNYVAKILELASQNFIGTKEDISLASGIPTGKARGKVVPHLKYAQHMGLLKYENIRGSYSLFLTDLGFEVFNQDPYMVETITKWICHFGITNIVYGAPQWNYIFNNFIHEYSAAISNDFIKAKAIEYFGFDVDFGVVKGSYSSGCFESLGIIDWTRSLKYNECYANRENIFLYAYSLLLNWEMFFSDLKEITNLQIRESLGWMNTFGFQEDEMNMVIDELSDLGYIAANRQLYPVTVVKLCNSKDIIPQLYNNLM